MRAVVLAPLASRPPSIFDEGWRRMFYLTFESETFEYSGFEDAFFFCMKMFEGAVEICICSDFR